MKMKLDNLQKPDNKRLKKIADIALYSLPFLIGSILTMPVSPEIQNWIIFGLNLLVVGFKALSKFSIEEEVV